MKIASFSVENNIVDNFINAPLVLASDGRAHDSILKEGWPKIYFLALIGLFRGSVGMCL